MDRITKHQKAENQSSINIDLIKNRMSRQFEDKDPYLLEDLEALTGTMDKEVQARSMDTILLMKLESLLKYGRAKEAYEEMAEFLKKNPFPLVLDVVRESIFSELYANLRKMMDEDPQNSEIDEVYSILSKESRISVVASVQYLGCLISRKEHKKAVHLAEALIKSSPGLSSLKDACRRLPANAISESIRSYIDRNQKSPGVIFNTTPLTREEMATFLETFKRLRARMKNSEDPSSIYADLKKHLGSPEGRTEMRVALKELYYMEGILQEYLGNYLQSFEIFQLLCEMDPFNLTYQRSLSYEGKYATMQILEKDWKDSPQEFLNITEYIRDWAVLPYSHVSAIALKMSELGLRAEAKELALSVLAINPLDVDYLASCLDVAAAIEDHKWRAELLATADAILRERPWEKELHERVTNF